MIVLEYIEFYSKGYSIIMDYCNGIKGFINLI
jgi:hypothetical protein